MGTWLGHGLTGALVRLCESALHPVLQISLLYRSLKHLL